jgi:predicted ArsR family transcriptional regulator
MMGRRAIDSRESALRELTERARNDPHRMRARKTEAEIIKMMPAGAWLSCTAIARLIGVPDERKIRARLDRLAHDGKIERKREQGGHGLVYLYRTLATSADSVPQDLAQLRLLISDLRRQIWNLEISIEANKDDALVRDIRTRRDNLLATVSTLETYLNDLGA